MARSRRVASIRPHLANRARWLASLRSPIGRYGDGLSLRRVRKDILTVITLLLATTAQASTHGMFVEAERGFTVWRAISVGEMPGEDEMAIVASIQKRHRKTYSSLRGFYREAYAHFRRGRHPFRRWVRYLDHRRVTKKVGVSASIRFAGHLQLALHLKRNTPKAIGAKVRQAFILAQAFRRGVLVKLGAPCEWDKRLAFRLESLGFDYESLRWAYACRVELKRVLVGKVELGFVPPLRRKDERKNAYAARARDDRARRRPAALFRAHVVLAALKKTKNPEQLEALLAQAPESQRDGLLALAAANPFR